MSNLGNKNIMAKNIKRLLAKNNKNRSDLAQGINISYSTVSEWINANAYPRIDKIEMMANYFGVSKSDLVEDIEDTPKGFKVPVLGEVAAGTPIEAVEDIIDYEELPIAWKSKGEFFGLQIKGNSMQPKMDEGDVVIVKQQSDAETGDTIIAIVNGNNATCKKLKKTDNGLMLISTNPEYEPMFYTWQEVKEKPVTIIGKVIELRAKF